MQPSLPRLALIQLHAGVILAGAAGLFAKLISTSPAVLTCARSFFGCVALMVVAVVLKSSLRVHNRFDLLKLALSGAILAAHWFVFFHAIQVANVAIVLLTFAAFPLFLTFLEPVIFGERLQRQDIVITVLVVAGLLLVTPSLDITDGLTQGFLWGVLSAFLFAILSLLNRATVRIYPAVAVTFYQQAFAAAFALPFAFTWYTPLSMQDVLHLMLLGVVFTGLAQVLIVASLRRLRAQVAGVVFGLEPVYGIVLAWLVLGEIPAARTLAGGCLISCAVMWTSLQQKASDH